MSESVAILKARIDELARANAIFRRQHDEIRHLDSLRHLGEQMLGCAREAIIATDLEGRIIFWNNYAERLYGWESEEVLGLNVVRVLPATAAVAEAEKIMERLRQGEAWSGEFHVRTRDGREFDVSVTSTPLRAESGKVIGIIGVSSNVTELKRLQRLQKQAEDALKESERRFRTIFENAGIGIALVDTSGCPVAVNPALARMLGYSGDELSRMVFTDFTHPDDAERDWALFREVAEGRLESYQMEKRYCRKDQSVVWGKLTASLVRDSEGRPQYGIGMVEDISEQKEAEESNRKLLHDLAERVKELTALHGAAHILQPGIDNTDAVLDDLVSLLPSAFQYPEITAARIRLGEHESATPHFAPSSSLLRTGFTTADGREGSIEVVYTKERPPEKEGPFLSEERALIDTLADMLRAAYDRRQGEAALRERTAQLHALTARLHAVREEEALRIARELHDELGQAMTGMTMELAAVQRQLDPNQKVIPIREVQEKLAGVRQLLDRTIASTRKICTELRPALLDQLGLLPALTAQAEEFEAHTGIFCDLLMPSEEVRLAPESAVAVFRIFQEILTNIARHSGATEATVQLTIGGSKLRLEVADNGRGATKAEMEGGSGLGLVGMRERAIAAGGELQVEAEPGNGIRVILSVPCPENRGG
jgi:PAS domain S-box-containing protein